MPIAKMPNTSSYKVKFFLSEREYKLIEKDFPFEARLHSKAIIKGKIKSKAPIGKPIKKNSKVKVFEVIATVDSLNFKPKPGQSVRCDITTKTIPDAYILPLLTIFHEDSINVVYVSHQNKFERRPITIAYKNATQAIVKNGLEADEEVALAKPHKSLIMKNHESNE
jgi:hypothetical protein